MIVGESKWGGPLAAYRQIVGLERERRNPSTEFGTFAEPFVARRYAAVHGVALRKPGTVLHPTEGAWLAASLDYVAVDGAGRWDHLVEVKTADESQRDEWGVAGTSQVPTGYIVQAAVECACSEIDSLVWAVLIGRSFHEYRFERDARFEADLLGLLKDFHVNHVACRKPPDDEDRMLFTTTLWPRDDGSVADLRDDGEITAAARRLREITRLAKSLEREGRALRGRIAEAAAGAASAMTAEGQFRHRTKRVAPRPDAGALERLARSLGAGHEAIAACYSRPYEVREFALPHAWRNDQDKEETDV